MNANSDGLAGGSCSPSVACPVSQGAQPASALPGPLSGLPGSGLSETDGLPTCRAYAGRYGATSKPHIYPRRGHADKLRWMCKSRDGVGRSVSPASAFEAWRQSVQYRAAHNRSCYR